MTSEEHTLIIAILVFCIIFGALGALMGYLRGHLVLGAIIGAALGPIGFLLMLAARDDRYKCDACKMPVARDASICPNCRTPRIASGVIKNS